MKSYFMKAMVMFIFFAIFASVANAGGIGTYSEGYRMGEITKFSVKGMMFKSGEGQMLMGSESTPYARGKGDFKVAVNPWYFSASSPTIQKQLKQNIGEYAVIRYKESQIKDPRVDTPYEVVEVSPISHRLHKTCEAVNYEKGRKSSGVRSGRIVKASSKGHLLKSWELIIQQGNAGNQFKHMTITDDKALYECAVDYLKAGQKVKIHYQEKFLSFGEDSNYSIVKIEPAGGLN